MLTKIRLNAVETLMRTILRVVFIALMLCCITSGRVWAADSSCGCADTADLHNRYCEARAAIAEYGKQISMIRKQEEKTGKTVMYTVPRYKEHVQPCVQEAINQVTDANTNRPSADTNNACQITVKGNTTACLTQVLNSHESVHQTVCQKWANEKADEGYFAELRSRFSDFREGTTMVDLLNEERAAYNVELNRIRQEFARLSPQCEGLKPDPQDPRRLPTIKPCPEEKPRPKPEDSLCRHR
jgi:hypothetical protein